MAVKTIPDFTENALTVLCKRYLSKAGEAVHAECTRCGQYHETPVELLQRASFGVEDFYELMARKDFFPNSPTLFNAGLDNGGTFSGCFKFDVADNMLEPSGIMDVAVKAAGVMKWGGGVGYSLSGLREKGAIIRSTHGFACGPVSVMQNLYQGVATMITQAGKRDGAQMAILHCDHPDAEEFINSKSENPKVLDTFNISLACTNEFMRKATEEPGSRECELLWQMARAAHKTGDPGCYFIDIAEVANPTPWLGQLTGTNPCGEVPLMDNEPCNLGSINLKNFVIPNHRYDVSAFGDLPESRYQDTGPQFDFNRLREVAHVATRFLDRILDENTFPHPDIDTMARKTRKLGLGVMGWADALALMHIDYDSEEALELGERIMEAVQTAAHETSEVLATEKGRAPAFEDGFPEEYMETLTVVHGVRPSDLSTYTRRNATLTCIAPTGTISIIAGCSSSIEPHFALENTRYMGDGTPLAEMVNVESGWIPKVAHQVDWRWHLRHQMAFQEHVDLAVSKTINVPVGISPEEIHEIYIEAWQSGCKGITIYRDHSQARQVLETNGKGPADLLKGYPGNTTGSCCKEFGETGKHSHSEGPFDDDPDTIIPILPLVTSRVGLPDERQAMIHRFQIGNVDGYLTCGMYPDGRLGEIFVRASRQGSTIDGLLDTIAMLTSHCLQHGVPLEYLVEKMKGRSFEPSGLTGNSSVPHASSIVDYIFRWLAEQFLTEDQKVYTNGVSHTGQTCPDCGHMTVNQSNCDLCPQCGWERC